MIKKIICVFMTAIMSFCLCACTKEKVTMLQNSSQEAEPIDIVQEEIPLGDIPVVAKEMTSSTQSSIPLGYENYTDEIYGFSVCYNQNEPPIEDMGIIFTKDSEYMLKIISSNKIEELDDTQKRALLEDAFVKDYAEQVFGLSEFSWTGDAALIYNLDGFFERPFNAVWDGMKLVDAKFYYGNANDAFHSFVAGTFETATQDGEYELANLLSTLSFDITK